MKQMIDKEVFDTFFKESYIPLEYKIIEKEFEEIASVGYDIFSPELGDKELTALNFILYLRSEIYCSFEACVEENFEIINPEIVDAVMDISATMAGQDDITVSYWDMLDTLLKKFLHTLYEKKFQGRDIR